jgi:DMSO/TMAO reductase YedYZ molybdopterin-dependent catalytic subunit
MQNDEAEFLSERQDQWEAAVRAEHGLSRREALRLAATGAFGAAVAGSPFLAGGRASAATAPRPRPGAPAPAGTPRPVPGVLKAQPTNLLIARGTNSEMQWSAMKGAGYHTPADRFFVRNHTNSVLIDPSTWRLNVWGDGLVAGALGPKTYTLKDLQKFEPAEAVVSVECAGNGRSFFGTQQHQPAAGTAWTLGAIGVARWRGVRLADVLHDAGLAPDVIDVMPQGLDPLVITGTVNSGHVRRPLPIAKALKDAIIAFEMNGHNLPPDHGFPARLIVPGWVGVANTKWLGSIQVSREPLFSTWNTTQYRLQGPGFPADQPPLTANPLKSAFELPLGATLPAGQPTTLTGRSWSGRARPKSVAVSTDGGATYRPAKLGKRDPYAAWVQWSIDWTPTTPGPVQLLARATDAQGIGQPDSTRFNTGGYWFDAVVKHPVTVTA